VTGPAAEISDRLAGCACPKALPARIPRSAPSPRRSGPRASNASSCSEWAGRASRPSSIKGRWRRSRASAADRPRQHPPRGRGRGRAAIDIRRTLFRRPRASPGTTIEPLSVLRYFWEKAGGSTRVPAAGSPRSPIPARRSRRGPGSAASGGRSRRSRRRGPLLGADRFRLVPAALIGADAGALLASAQAAAAADGPDVPPPNPGPAPRRGPG